MDHGFTWVHICEGHEELSNSKRLWTYNDQTLISNKMCNETGRFLEVVPGVAFLSFRAGGSECTACAPCTPPPCCAKPVNSAPDTRARIPDCTVSCICGVSALTEMRWFNYRKSWLLLFPYRDSSACKCQIRLSLDSIVLECLMLKVAVLNW